MPITPDTPFTSFPIPTAEVDENAAAIRAALGFTTAGSAMVTAADAAAQAALLPVVGTSGNQTVAGNKTFSGQVEGTGQTAATADSFMTRGLTSIEGMFNIGVVKTLSQFLALGTGISYGSSGDDYTLYTAATSGALARYILARNLTSNGAWGTSTLDCSKNFDLAFSFAALLVHADSKCRITFGVSGTQPTASEAPLSAKGWGIEWGYFSANTLRVKLFAFDSVLAWSSGSISIPAYGTGNYFLRKSGNTLSLWKVGINDRIDITAAPVLTMSGAPNTGSAGNILLCADLAAGGGSASANALRLMSLPMVRIWS